MSSDKTERGYTVIEALVAVFLMAVAIAPLIALQSQASRGVLAVERSLSRSVALENALGYLSVINIAENPTGNLSSEGWQVSWNSEQISDYQRARFQGAEGNFELALYRVTIRLSKEGVETSKHVTRIGWRPLFENPADVF